MKTFEKLIRLLECRHKAAIARRAGIGETTLYNMIARKSEPKASTALALANALDVDVRWLIDDSQEWPPVSVRSTEPAHAA